MAKYNVFANYTYCELIGEVEANSEEEAIDKVLDEGNYESMIKLCCECSRKVDELILDDESIRAEKL